MNSLERSIFCLIFVEPLKNQTFCKRPLRLFPDCCFQLGVTGVESTRRLNRKCLPFLWAVDRRKITLSATISFFLPDVASPYSPLGVMCVQHSFSSEGKKCCVLSLIDYPMLLYPSTGRGELARLFRLVGKSEKLHPHHSHAHGFCIETRGS